MEGSHDALQEGKVLPTGTASVPAEPTRISPEKPCPPSRTIRRTERDRKARRHAATGRPSSQLDPYSIYTPTIRRSGHASDMQAHPNPAWARRAHIWAEGRRRRCPTAARRAAVLHYPQHHEHAVMTPATAGADLQSPSAHRRRRAVAPRDSLHACG